MFGKALGECWFEKKPAAGGPWCSVAKVIGVSLAAVGFDTPRWFAVRKGTVAVGLSMKEKTHFLWQQHISTTRVAIANKIKKRSTTITWLMSTALPLLLAAA